MGKKIQVPSTIRNLRNFRILSNFRNLRILSSFRNLLNNPKKTLPVILTCIFLIAVAFLWYAAYHSRYHAINHVRALHIETESDGNLGVPIKVFIATHKNEDAAERWVEVEEQHDEPHVCLNQSNTRIKSTFTFKVDNDDLTLDEMHKIADLLFPGNPIDITI